MCMGFGEHSFYHVFNRGNNKQKIFFKQENYEFFLDKIHKHIEPHCDIMAYCLMPNHFHLLVSTNESIIELTKGLQITLSSYTRAINEQESRCGSLFQQNTRKKLINVNDNGAYLKRVIDYIHENPVRAKLCDLPEDWKFSSYNEYFDIKPLYRYICNTDSTKDYVDDFELRFNIKTAFENSILFHRLE